MVIFMATLVVYTLTIVITSYSIHYTKLYDVGAGATSGGSMDASNLLKPALQAGILRCIGSTTYEEYKNQIEKDRALSRRFQKIDISEPTVDDTHLILKGLQSKYEKHHDVRYSKSRNNFV